MVMDSKKSPRDRRRVARINARCGWPSGYSFQAVAPGAFHQALDSIADTGSGMVVTYLLCWPARPWR